MISIKIEPFIGKTLEIEDYSGKNRIFKRYHNGNYVEIIEGRDEPVIDIPFLYKIELKLTAFLQSTAK